jgi:hypothetical protein
MDETLAQEWLNTCPFLDDFHINKMKFNGHLTQELFEDLKTGFSNREYSYNLQWSFGVLLWELTTLAQQPYVEVDPFEMAAYLRDGYRLSQPINCPDEL